MGLISFVHRDTFRLHENPSMHPEKPDRLVAIDKAVGESELSDILVDVAPWAATEKDLARIHSPSYLEHLEKIGRLARTENRFIQLDGDTFMSPWTLETAKLAAGTGCMAIKSLQGEKITAAFVAARPPGHHAMAERQMGFCIFNNIALATVYAREILGYKRVLIIDWDVHHGNGTQDIFYEDPNVLFISMHQYPHWPYDTGWLTEDGKGEGKGFNLNIPLPAGIGDKGHLLAWDSIIVPVSMEYKPDIILVSAGYDAHQNDPMSSQQITTAGFGLLASRLRDLADKLGIKCACFLEGGYDTKALADSVVATLRALAKNKDDRNIESELKPITGDWSPEELKDRLSLVQKHFTKYWPSLK